MLAIVDVTQQKFNLMRTYFENHPVTTGLDSQMRNCGLARAKHKREAIDTFDSSHYTYYLMPNSEVLRNYKETGGTFYVNRRTFHSPKRGRVN